MATFTMSLLDANVKSVHTGVVAVGSALSLSVTGTASSILLMAKVPHGATLLDFWLKMHTGGAAQTIKLGTSASPSGIMAITSLSQTYSVSASSQLVVPTPYGIFNQGFLVAPGGTTGGSTDLMPVRISLSDDAAPKWVWVQGTLGVAISASAFFTFMLFYTMDGMTGHTTIR